jgi:sec-independent protein translocase protein TatB
MFDIGFSELMVVALVALIVIGPEKLPRVARTLGHLAGRLQRYVSDVKSDISREMDLEDLRNVRDSMKEAASTFEASVKSELDSTESELNKSVEAAMEDKPAVQDKPPAEDKAQEKTSEDVKPA